MKRKRPVDSLEDAAKRCRAQVIPEDAPIGQVSSKNEDFVMRAGSFDVILVIDQREVQNHKDSTAVLTTSLQAAHIPFTFRTLPIGDFTWICKHREQDGVEVTLDYIVERKREDDLVSSIIDGRYDEQKFRLKRSRIRHVIYLIEKLPPNPFMQRRPKANDDAESSTTTRNSTASSAACYSVEKFGRGKFLAALLSTQINNQFFLKWTKNFGDTLAYIVSLSKHLNAKYSTRDIKIMPDHMADQYFTYGLLQGPSNPAASEGPSDTPKSQRGPPSLSLLASPIYHCRYDDFSKLHTKTMFMTQRDLYIKQLCCILLMSTERAMAISSIYPTMFHLMSAYKALDDGLNDHQQTDLKRRAMLKDIIYEAPSKKIGEKLSERIYCTLYGINEEQIN